jgi:hypothetical protein
MPIVPAATVAHHARAVQRRADVDDRRQHSGVRKTRCQTLVGFDAILKRAR